MASKKLNSIQRLQEAVLMIAALLALYLLLALLSFDPIDRSWLHATPLQPVHNLAGSVGAGLADTLFFVFGLFAYMLPLVILLLSGMCFYRCRCAQYPFDKLMLTLHLTGCILLLLTTCGLAALLIDDPEYFTAGGVIGSVLTEVMMPWFNRSGSALLFICLWGVGFTLLSGCSWITILHKLATVTLCIFTMIKAWLYRVMLQLKQWGVKIFSSSSPLKENKIVHQSRAEPLLTPVEPWLSPASSPNHPCFEQPVNPAWATAAPLNSTAESDPCNVQALDQEFPFEWPETPTSLPNAVSTPCSSYQQKSLSGLSDQTDISATSVVLPTLDLLTAPPEGDPVSTLQQEDLERTAESVETHLADYRVQASVVGISPGPVITRYELSLAPGIKAARISTLARDLARSLSVVAVRVVEVIPGKPYVGLELPNKQRQTVYLREVFNCNAFKHSTAPLTLVLGKDSAGHPLVADLAKMPHLLVAGTTGSGKSVGVNAMILSMLYKATPDEVRFIMIDPKMLELSVYEGIPHLLTEVVTDMKDAANALRWCVNEMERRYKLMSLLGVRNISGYNERIQQAQGLGQPILDPLWRCGDSTENAPPSLMCLPYIVVLVDEFADLMMTAGKKVEELIARLAQKARAAGIHLVLATQRPSVDVITGLIKANIPTRIAFTVSSKIDSRTILDQTGAESLLGMGDMLYLPPNSSLPIRVHGAFVSDQEVHAVVNDWKARGRPQYLEAILVDTESRDNGSSTRAEREEALDALFDEAVAFVAETRRGSISSVQRKFKIGYNRAARIIEQMEAEGIVSPPGHNGNREVLLPEHIRE